MYEIYYDSEDESYLLKEKEGNKFLITPTSILIMSLPLTTQNINIIYNKIIKEHYEKISNITTNR